MTIRKKSKDESLEKRVHGLTPSIAPDLHLPERWVDEFKELMDTGNYNQTEILDIMAERYRCNCTTIYRNIFHSQKEKEKKSPSKQWSHITSRPSFDRQKFNATKAMREKVKYHISEYVTRVFSQSQNEPIELPVLSDRVKELSGVYFLPVSFLTMSASMKKKTGLPLLQRVDGYDLPRYALHTNPQNG